MLPAIPLHKNDHLNNLAFIITIVAGGLTIFYLANQTKLLRLQIQKHDSEMKLMGLEIKKHEKEFAPADSNSGSHPPEAGPRSPWV